MHNITDKGFLYNVRYKFSDFILIVVLMIYVYVSLVFSFVFWIRSVFTRELEAVIICLFLYYIRNKAI